MISDNIHLHTPPCPFRMIPQPPFLPMSREEGKRLGIDQFDIILVTGDAYVDHPSFGTALIGRVLWDAGFTVGIIAQPDWKSDTDLPHWEPRGSSLASHPAMSIRW